MKTRPVRAPGLQATGLSAKSCRPRALTRRSSMMAGQRTLLPPRSRSRLHPGTLSLCCDNVATMLRFRVCPGHFGPAIEIRESRIIANVYAAILRVRAKPRTCPDAFASLRRHQQTKRGIPSGCPTGRQLEGSVVEQRPVRGRPSAATPNSRTVPVVFPNAAFVSHTLERVTGRAPQRVAGDPRLLWYALPAGAAR